MIRYKEAWLVQERGTALKSMPYLLDLVLQQGTNFYDCILHRVVKTFTNT